MDNVATWENLIDAVDAILRVAYFICMSKQMQSVNVSEYLNDIL